VYGGIDDIATSEALSRIRGASPGELDTLSAIARELKLSTGIAPRVLRLDPASGKGDAGVMLAPGERDLDILPNTITPERHLGYAVQWFGLALTVLVIAIVLTVRARKRPSQ
jgi:cytochrome oxidase assembly protein ShyY1